jgi:hypothetical protein
MTTGNPAVNTPNYVEQGGARTVIGGEIDIVSGGKLKINGVDVTAGAGGSNVAGVAAGYKVARGVHQQAAASDTIVTGLTTVIAIVASWRDTPTLKQMFVTATIGDQAGAPAAGSVLIKTFKPTANNDVTPTAATDFTDNLSVDWIAIGT